MLIGLVMVTAPKPPGSRTLISPAAEVFEMAPANVLHGAVRLHGLASSPTPETQVRVAWACAAVVSAQKLMAKPTKNSQRIRFMNQPSLMCWRSERADEALRCTARLVLRKCAAVR